MKPLILTLALLHGADAITTDVVLTPGKGIQLFVQTGNPTAGTGVVRVKVAYRVHATGF